MSYLTKNRIFESYRENNVIALKKNKTLKIGAYDVDQSNLDQSKER